MSTHDHDQPTRTENALWFVAFTGAYIAAASALLMAADALHLGG